MSELIWGMTPQEAFTKAVVETYKQGRKSRRDDDAFCQYEFNGLKCAIGHLMPDEIRANADVRGYTVSGMSLWGWLPASHERWLIWLQSAHDEASNDNFRAAFWNVAEEIAKSYGFVMPPKPEVE